MDYMGDCVGEYYRAYEGESWDCNDLVVGVYMDSGFPEVLVACPEDKATLPRI